MFSAKRRKQSKTFLFIFLVSVVTSCAQQSSSDQSPASQANEFENALAEFNKRPIHKRLTSEIFDAISDDDLELAVMDNIWSKMDKDMSNESSVVDGLSRPQQNIYIVWQVEAEVNNGGFNQFYFNSSGRYAERAVSAFKELGAVKYADLMQRANSIYGKEHDRLKAYDDGTIDGFSRSYENNPLNALDEEFYRLDENLQKLKVAYMRRNKAAFIVR